MIRYLALVSVCLCASVASAADRAGCGGLQDAAATRFARQWFSDARELDRRWVETHASRDLPTERRLFCAERQSGRTSALISENPNDNTLGFANPPGPLNTGMCWLHSRLPRRMTYLANFRPDLPRPSAEEAQRIIRRIVGGDAVVEIPGFRNLHDFSSAYRSGFEGALVEMGARCMANPTDCLPRVADSDHPSPQAVRDTLDAVRDQAERQPGDVHFLRLKVREFSERYSPLLRPFVSHAMLVLSIEPIARDNRPIGAAAAGTLLDIARDQQRRPRDGYHLRIVDSNFPALIQDVYYHYGDDRLDTFGGTFEPYGHYEYAGDIPQMRGAIDRYCHNPASEGGDR